MNQLSIVMCTRNRSHLLCALFDCFDHEVFLPPDFDVEMIIVDNNSTDTTRNIVQDYISQKRSYALRYVFEGKNGLSYARNRGIDEAKFERIGFLDDDILPDPAYFKALRNAFAENANITCFAHKVITHPLNKPDWYHLEGKNGMLRRGMYDLGNISRLLTSNDKIPIGSGMVISKSLFVSLGRFNTNFGYDFSKSIMIPGEESEFFFKIKSRNVPIYYIADAVIHHYPGKEKYDIDTLCKTYKRTGYWYGSADARNLRNKNIIIWAGYPRSYYKRLIRTGFNFVFSRFSFSKTVRYYHRFEWERTKGYFKGYSDFRKKKDL